MDPHLRASDLDREHVIHVLTDHTATGRLSLDEFAARVDVVNRSKTYGELAAVTADLPLVGEVLPADRRPTLAAFAVPAVLMAVLLGLLLVVAGVGWGDMNAMMASMSAAMGCR